MTLWLIVFAFLVVLAGTAVVQFWAHMRTLGAGEESAAPFVDTDRYRPMLRLLADKDTALTTNPAMRRKLRAQRCDTFREYLRYLTGDYGKLLAGVRLVMSQSSVDRPDLAKALLKNQVLFAVALCRVDLRLRLYTLGIGRTEALNLDVRGLVDALDVLRGQFSFLAESAVWGA